MMIRLVTRYRDMPKAIYPSLYQVNTRVWLTELSQELGRPALDMSPWQAAVFSLTKIP
jgi:hypothetical protein